MLALSIVSEKMVVSVSEGQWVAGMSCLVFFFSLIFLLGKDERRRNGVFLPLL